MDKAVHEVAVECQIPAPAQHPLRLDYLAYRGASPTRLPYLLRRVVVWDAEHEREIVLLTNLLKFRATTVRAI